MKTQEGQNVMSREKIVSLNKAEENQKKSLGGYLVGLMKSEGTIGRIRNKQRNLGWRRLLNLRDKKTTDEEIKQLMEQQFELIFSQALLNGLSEAADKDGDYSVETVECLVTFLGTRTSAIKAFSEEDEIDNEGI